MMVVNLVDLFVLSMLRFLILILTFLMVFLFTNFLTNVMVSPFSSFECPISEATFHHTLFMDQLCQSFSEYLVALFFTLTLCRQRSVQGGSKEQILKQISKAVIRHPLPFKKFNKRARDIMNDIF